MAKKYLVIILALYFNLVGGDKPPCDSDIYCYGPLLHTIQRSGIFKDSKTFVDMSLKFEPEIIKKNFEYFLLKSPNGTLEMLRNFLDTNFNPAGGELEQWIPTDWKSQPAFLEKIQDPKLRNFAEEINHIWKVLGRRIKGEVKNRSHFYSIIPVKNPFIVPGGRFNEFYYWDQFWVVKGLLHSGMIETVRGMLENLLEMVEMFGFVPNGGRIYYQRSQPPLLIPMVDEFLEVTDDILFLKNHISLLDLEFEFWMRNRTYTLEIGGQNLTVMRYNVELNGPRPESYNEDYSLAKHFKDSEAKKEFYMHLKTAAESGIDFSSRWFVPKNASTTGLLIDCKARNIIPVDLNVLILRNAKLLEKFHKKLGNYQKALYYLDIGKQWERTINTVFWNETEGSWFDYIDSPLRRGHKADFYPGNILPLILNLPSMTNKTSQVLEYLKQTEVLKYVGGIPSSLIHSGEQWDYPNAWAPHVHWFIESLEATGNVEATKIARETAQKWLVNNYVTYKNHNNTMFEKYDVETIGLAGGGGEYDVVVGFGWSNGAILDLLVKYGDYLTVP